MKYVFVINSHTTFLTSLGVVKYLKLPANSITLLYVRNYQNTIINVPYLTENISSLYDSCKYLFKNGIIRNKIINNIDRTIENVINDDYELFVPHLGNGLFQILYTHPCCKKVSYIQEGGIPFKTAYKTRLSLVEKTTYWLYNTLYLRTDRIWKPFRWYVQGNIKVSEKLNSYAISNTFFKYLPSHNHIIMWPEIPISITIEPRSTIFIFDGFVHHGFVERDLYIELSHKLIEEYHNTKNYIRFHPAQDDKERMSILSFFYKMKLSFEIMNEDIPFELIISSVKDLCIVGFGSSLLYFAKDYGHTVICRDRWLHVSELYNKYKNKYGFEYFDVNTNN